MAEKSKLLSNSKYWEHAETWNKWQYLFKQKRMPVAKFLISLRKVMPASEKVRLQQGCSHRINVRHLLLLTTYLNIICPSFFTSTHLKVTNMFENKGIVDVDLFADFVIHGVYICLVHRHTLLGQRRCIVYGNIMEFWVILPVLI